MAMNSDGVEYGSKHALGLIEEMPLQPLGAHSRNMMIEVHASREKHDDFIEVP